MVEEQKRIGLLGFVVRENTGELDSRAVVSRMSVKYRVLHSSLLVPDYVKYTISDPQDRCLSAIINGLIFNDIEIDDITAMPNGRGLFLQRSFKNNLWFYTLLLIFSVLIYIYNARSRRCKIGLA
jgi:hypothetical protein